MSEPDTSISTVKTQTVPPSIPAYFGQQSYRLFFYTQLSMLSVMYCLFKTHWSSIIIITESCCRLVGESDSGPTTQISPILTEACS